MQFRGLSDSNYGGLLVLLLGLHQVRRCSSNSGLVQLLSDWWFGNVGVSESYHSWAGLLSLPWSCSCCFIQFWAADLSILLGRCLVFVVVWMLSVKGLGFSVSQLVLPPSLFGPCRRYLTFFLFVGLFPLVVGYLEFCSVFSCYCCLCLGS